MSSFFLANVISAEFGGSYTPKGRERGGTTYESFSFFLPLSFVSILLSEGALSLAVAAGGTEGEVTEEGAGRVAAGVLEDDASVDVHRTGARAMTVTLGNARAACTTRRGILADIVDEEVTTTSCPDFSTSHAQVAIAI